MITDSWHTIFKRERLNVVDRPILARATTDWPCYITTNWPQVVPQKAYRCQDKQNILTSHSSQGSHLCKTQLLGFYVSFCVHASVMRLRWNAVLYHIYIYIYIHIYIYSIWWTQNSGTVPWWSGTITWWSQITWLEWNMVCPLLMCNQW